MKLNNIKSTLLENTLDSILSEWEQKETETLEIETNNYFILINNVSLVDNELDISFKIKVKK